MPSAILTPRLRLVRWAIHDAEELRAVLDASDAHLRPWIPFMRHEPQSLEATREELAARAVAFERGESYRYAVRPLESTSLVGEVLILARDDAPSGHLELGYWVTPSAEGMGYATEAARGLLSAARAELPVTAIDLLCDVRNARSEGVARRLGAVKIGEEAAPSLSADADEDVLGRWRLAPTSSDAGA